MFAKYKNRHGFVRNTKREGANKKIASNRLRHISIIRYREKDSRMPNWIELPVNPPSARKIQIHNLSAGTSYEFQVSKTTSTKMLLRKVLLLSNPSLSPQSPAPIGPKF